MRDTVFVALARVKVFLCKVPVLIERLAVPECQVLPGLRRHTQFGIAGEILPEVDHGLAVRRLEELSLKALLLDDRHALGGGELFVTKVPHGYTVPVADFLHAGVIALALLQVVLPCRPLLAGFPVFVAAEDRLSADLKLAQEGDVLAIEVVQPVDADAAAIPAVAERDSDLVFAGLQQRGDVIGLHRQAL